MTTGSIIALVIVGLSLLMIIIVGIVTYNKAKPALKNIKETNEVITQKINYFTREGEHLTERVNLINKRLTLLQKEVDVKSAHFQDLTDENGKFQTSLRYLKEHSGEYATGIGTNIKDEVKEDGPKVLETFKRAFKKTMQKQKVRYQK